MYSKDFGENLKQRAKILVKARDNLELQALLKKKCADDPLYFFNMFLYTYKPKSIGNEGEPTNNNLPFITYPFQDEYIIDLIWCIENSQDSSTEKSREMGFSWMMLGIAMYGFLFKSRSGLIGSYKESYVDKQGDMDSAFERMRYILNKLPDWIKPNDIEVKFMSIGSKTLGCQIGGDSGVNFGTGGRRKWVFMDEFALWQSDEMAFRKTKDVTNCRIIGGTPEGKLNVYGKIMTNHPDYAHLKIRKFRLHWTAHPLKTQEWYEEQKLKRTKLDVAKELDISYDDSVTGAVYPDFTDKVKIKKVEYDADLKTYTSWDFGRDANVVIIWQKDFQFDKLKIVKTFSKENRDIDKFAAFITGKPTNGYDYTQAELEEIEWISNINTYANHYGDPYNGNAKTTNAKKSIQDILRELGIHLTLKTGTTLENRITNTHLSLSRFIIDEGCHEFIESMIQSRYPKKKEGSQSTAENKKPIHDGNSHYRTACEYFIDNEPIQVKINNKPPIFHNKMTGSMMQGGRSMNNRFGL